MRVCKLIISKDVLVYVKSTETCNLNCSHCFTSGSNGAKIFFNPVKTVNFLKKLTTEQSLNSLRLIYHGGEPLLAPVKDLYYFYNNTKDLASHVEYGIQTNLVFPLTADKMDFLNDVIKPYGLGTSWDHDIRFGSNSPGDAQLKSKQLNLWENNVKKLVDQDHTITLMVSLSKNLIQDLEPKEIVEYASKLGIKYILFERITSDGNTLDNLGILPKNKDIDNWLFKMFVQTMEFELYLKIGNMFLNEIAHTFIRRVHIANRCRNCEQSLITINADGTLSGCPNSAPKDTWGNIDQDLNSLLRSSCRVNAICSEMKRNEVCINCPVSSICNGDCYKLPWEGDVCAAPKTLMKFLKDNPNKYDLNKLILN